MRRQYPPVNRGDDLTKDRFILLAGAATHQPVFDIFAFQTGYPLKA